MDRVSRSVRVVWVAGLVWLSLVVGAGPAHAAFPGANGLLVVQPASGRGLLLVGEDGANPHRICSAGTRCSGARDPVWSPAGSEIAVSVRHRPSVIYADGSCLACSLPEPLDYGGGSIPTFDPGFLPDGRLVVSNPVYPPYGDGPAPGVVAMKTDGVGEQWLVYGSWHQLAWSSSGQLAAVRRVKRKSEVFVIDPRTGKARQLTRGGVSSPSWSPDGRRLAVVERGWIALVSSRGGPLRRLARGGAPAWAPNGQELAFVGAHHRLFVIAVRGGAPRAVGHIRAVRVDWQPVTGMPPTPCQAPAGSSVLATTPNATITIDGSPTAFYPGLADPISVLGCLTSDGHERLLESMSGDPAAGQVYEIGSVAVAGDYIALVNESLVSKPDLFQNWLAAFDLRTGSSVPSGDAQALCGFARPQPCGIDQLALSDTDGANAAHTFAPDDAAGRNCPFTERIVATDRTGTHTLDRATSKAPCNAPPPMKLTQLSLSGHTLTWSHAGSPRSAQLN